MYTILVIDPNTKVFNLCTRYFQTTKYKDSITVVHDFEYSSVMRRITKELLNFVVFEALFPYNHTHSSHDQAFGNLIADELMRCGIPGICFCSQPNHFIIKQFPCITKNNELDDLGIEKIIERIHINIERTSSVQ